MRSFLIVLVALVIPGAQASRAASTQQTPPAQPPSACKPAITDHESLSRGLPEVFYDQGRASVKAILPQHQWLAERRSGAIGKVTYALLAYQPGPGQRVSIQALAVDWTAKRAWNLSASCEMREWAAGLMLTMEAMAGLPAVGK